MKLIDQKPESKTREARWLVSVKGPQFKQVVECSWTVPAGAEELTRVRRELGLTFREAAEQIGIEVGDLIHLEAGHVIPAKGAPTYEDLALRLRPHQNGAPAASEKPEGQLTRKERQQTFWTTEEMGR